MRMYNKTIRLLLASVAIAILSTTVQAASRSTVAAGLWTNSAIWVDGNLPQAGDDVTVDHAVTLDQSTPSLGSFVNNAELTFDGWNTQLQATEVTVNATITHPVQSDLTGATGVYEDWTPDNRVWIVCSNLTVNSEKEINLNGKGYQGGVVGTPVGKGPGGGLTDGILGVGGGHGGRGGRSSATLGGTIYDDQVYPMDPGSGGGAGGSSKNRAGANGGGAVWIDASGLVTIHGTISSNGADVDGSVPVGGGGSGGSIRIDCVAITGTGGTLSANGGTGGDYFADKHGGDGGGGRIAIIYDTTQQALQNQEAMPDIAISSAGGFRTFDVTRGEPGTVYVPETSFFPSSTPGGVRLPGGIPSFTNWTPEKLTIDNTWVMMGSEIELDVSGDIVVTGSGGRLDVGEGSNIWTMTCGGNTIVTNGGSLNLRSAVTNGVVSYGGFVRIDDELVVYDNSTLFVHSSPFNGGSVKIEVGRLFVDNSATISAAGLGFSGGTIDNPEGFGPGGGGFVVSLAYGAGGGYGGQGGDSSSGAQGGIAYGSSNIVTQCGSGGGASRQEAGELGGPGGGLIWIEAAREVRVDGLLDANGFPSSRVGGGGAGGGIYLRCRLFSGNGELRAQGGDGGDVNGWSGAGGGGRIAVWRTHDEWMGLLSWPDAVAGGEAGGTYDGQPGTIVLGNILPAGTLMLLQ